jgi:hypothetical protein
MVMLAMNGITGARRAKDGITDGQGAEIETGEAVSPV